jgi:hydrogenase maturation protein HypF
MDILSGARIHITGIVQGVGFRPFVYALAQRYALDGWVRNTSAGVDIEVDGSPETLQAFSQALQAEAPPLAYIDHVRFSICPAHGYSGFEIVHSETLAGAFQPISPDVATCPDCLREMFDPQDRRYRYPFTNCTNCGPRFTIIEEIPYDRPNTTMADFAMCPDCLEEYSQPLNRRFHAQPIACPVCGPQLWLETTQVGSSDPLQSDAAIQAARRMLDEGKIVAIKGLGGFHLACDALNPDAVTELRRRKLRIDKPFALMLPDIETVSAHCELTEAGRQLLESRERPIVILNRRHTSTIADQAAPGQATLGIMLPYTPLHTLLFAPGSSDSHDKIKLTALVMTSGNLSEEPIAVDNQEAIARLAGLADAFLMHNRPIRTRCDDSVMRLYPALQPGNANTQGVLPPAHLPVRRSRGYAPFPVHLPFSAPPVLAVGAELKNTFCLAREGYAFLSHHIGDLENYETLQSFEDGIQHLQHLFRIQPQAIAYDLHPDYLSTRYALEQSQQIGLSALGVQPHHAHIAACMAENGLDGSQPVIGIAFDGTGYGFDGAIWGGEFLVADYAGFQRSMHLAYVPLPGGDKAIREPWRVALSWLRQAGVDWDSWLPTVRYASNLANANQQLNVLSRQIDTRLNAPLTSSMGRLFDAVASLSGVRHTAGYEAQAAIELEALADPGEMGEYPLIMPSLSQTSTATPIDISPMIKSLLIDLRNGISVSQISARFHNSLARLVLLACQEIRRSYGLDRVALSGGVWQNITLFEKTIRLLGQDGFTIYFHRLVPPNDGGISLGQAAVLIHKLNNRSLISS